jgi:hypothetical protein
MDSINEAQPGLCRFRPDVPVRDPDLAAVEATVRKAIDRRRSDELVLLGNGEFSLALQYGTGDDAIVIKRVPPFKNQELADEYIAVVDRYIADLVRNDVKCVATRQLTHRRRNGSVIVYHCQPLLDVDRLADRVLGVAEPSPDHPVIQAVLDAVVAVVEGGGTIDGQIANWYWWEDRLWQLDFSTPIYLNDKGHMAFPTSAFTREYPFLMRPIVVREMEKLVPPYFEVPHNVTEIMTHLIRAGLEQWCPAMHEAAARRGIHTSIDQARKAFDEQAKFYPALLRMKRMQRGWIEFTRRKYDVMLPAVTSYGR